jgi:Transposase domain (DUF772)
MIIMYGRCPLRLWEGSAVSIQLRPWPEVPQQTVSVARAAFPKGSLAMRVRDELPGLFTDEQFVSAFGVQGKPGISPGQLALVTVLQFVENLTDRQAADAVRARIDWNTRSVWSCPMRGSITRC